MREVKLNRYIVLGSSIRYLLDAHEGLPIRQPLNRNELALVGHMDRIDKELQQMGLYVTYQAFRAELRDLYISLRNFPIDARLSKEQADEVLEGINVVTNVLKYEATNLRAYIISDKRLDVNKLLSDVSTLFPKNVFYSLPDVAQYDFTQAGKCIAFEVPTAAAFHILRGTEDVLRSYYSALLPSAVPSPNLLWGPMVTALRGMATDSPPKELLDNLDNIRVSFRNPTQHPDKRYDLDEVQDLFNLCVDVVNRVAKDSFRRGAWVEIPF